MQVQYISRIGGFTVSQAVKRVLARILSNEVQNNINWLGQRGGKRSFRELKFCKALTREIKANEFKIYVLSELENCLNKLLF